MTCATCCRRCATAARPRYSRQGHLGAAGMPPNGGAPRRRQWRLRRRQPAAYGATRAGAVRALGGLANGAAGPGNTAAAQGIGGAAFGGQTVTGGPPGLDTGSRTTWRSAARPALGQAGARPFPEPNQRGQFGPPAGAGPAGAGRPPGRPGRRADLAVEPAGHRLDPDRRVGQRDRADRRHRQRRSSC